MKKIKKRELKIMFTITILVMSVFLFFQSFSLSNDPAYLYSVGHQTDYKVYLEQNDFIEQEYLEKDKVYVQDLVRYIDISFYYYYQASQKEKIKCLYDITATLFMDYGTNQQNLFRKEYPIVKNKILEQSNISQTKIEENLTLDYKTYLQEVQKFKEQFNLPIKAYLKVDFKVHTSVQLTEEVSKMSQSELTIDLSNPVFDIKVQETDEQNETILETENFIKNINFYLLGMSSILFILSFAGLLYQINRYRSVSITKMRIELNRILKKYADIIVELKEEPQLKTNNVILVKSFNELLDVEEEIREPILFYETKKGENVFLIVGNQITYQYYF